MTTQSELILEKELLKQLETLWYTRITIRDEAELLANLKIQLEVHNKVKLTEKEFSMVLNHLSKGNVFEKAKILRDKMQLTKEDGTSIYLEFINQKNWCQNEYQVTNQVTQEGKYKNRYDVTILINGLPLVQVELKRRGLELKEAFNQTNRYQKHSYDSSYGLFQYIQIFVISNGVNTKYYANNKNQSFKQTFYRADRENKVITQLERFTKEFLEPCHLSKMITKYTVLAETKILMVLRPYQYYAVEAIVERVKNGKNNGYIWHTTGSGKTLTSFKASQIIDDIPEVTKVVFVVDRKDLDSQTIIEFNSFSKWSVDGTDNTRTLVKQLTDDTKLVVTTIQKLNTAISKIRYGAKMEKIKDERVVFIFDECHRSQFGDTHRRIKEFFTNHQMFGFTWTPILAENHSKGKTTKDLFGECLHKYVITDAIKDENVLKFSIEYVGKYKEKEGSRNEIDIKVEDIDTKELLESPARLEKIVDYIIANHERKTHGKEFTAMFCVGSVDSLVKYYDIFKQKKTNLRIATVFSYAANEEDADANGLLPDELTIEDNIPVNKHSREKLDEYINDYNGMFGSNFSTKDTQSFYNYYKDIAKQVKARKIDILLVVNMFLTGFDSPSLNTLYVDKNLKYHGLIQAFSRTNRILNEKKSQGNIVSFRNLKKATDDAITLFSNKEAIEVVLMEPYESYVEKFNRRLKDLTDVVPTVESVSYLEDEEEELLFIKIFRELIRLKNILWWFADFNFGDLKIDEQRFEDYKSKYLDIYDKVRLANKKEKASILNDVDFEIELIHRDDVNVAYILRLLAKLKLEQLKNNNSGEADKQYKGIMKTIASDTTLRSKRELIEKFMEKNLPQIDGANDIEDAFYVFRDEQKKEAFDKLCKEEKLIPEKLAKIIEGYIFTEKKPLRDDIIAALNFKLKLLERAKIVSRVTKKILYFVETYITGVGNPVND